MEYRGSVFSLMYQGLLVNIVDSKVVTAEEAEVETSNIKEV